MSPAGAPPKTFVPAHGKIISRLRAFPATSAARREVLEANHRKGNHKVIYDDLTFEIFENVFSPTVFESTFLYTERLAKGDIEFRNKDMLEMGCGAGIAGLYLMKKHKLKSLVLADISAEAVRCAAQNSRNLGVEDKISVVQSDVFESIPPERKFDVLYWNHAWNTEGSDYQCKHILERSVFDPGYKGLQAFIGGAAQYLKPGGRIFLGFGDFGDIEALEKISTYYGYEITEILRYPKYTDVSDKPIHFLLYELRLLP